MSQSDGQSAAFRSDASKRVFGRHGGYRNQRAYQVALLLYEFTCRFSDRYIPFKDRHHDQMVQSARSGYQNLAEGSVDSATSKKLEMNLTNVARGSLDELRKDYIAYRTRWSHGLSQWAPGDPRFIEARNLRPQTMDDIIAWVNRPADQPTRERAANLGAILAAQAEWLAGRMLDSQAEAFEQDGGFSERLYHARRRSNPRSR